MILMLFSIDGLRKTDECACKHLSNQNLNTLGRHFADRLSAMVVMSFSLMLQNMREEQLIRRTIVGLHLHLQNEAIKHYRIFKSAYGGHIYSLLLAVIYENPDKKGIAERLEQNINSSYITS